MMNPNRGDHSAALRHSSSGSVASLLHLVHMLPGSSTLRGALTTVAALIPLAAITPLAALPALAQEDHHSGHPEGHAPTDRASHHQHHAGGDIAPIGLMGTHMHPADEFMLSYLYTRMGMDGNLDGGDHISRSRILSPAGENFRVTPTSMDMEMHMFRLMYAPMDQLTLMAMLPYLIIEMDHRTRMGAKFTTRSRGVGDFKLSALSSASTMRAFITCTQTLESASRPGGSTGATRIR